MLPPSIICLDTSKHIEDYRLMIYALPQLGYKISPRLWLIPEIHRSFVWHFEVKQQQPIELITKPRREKEREGGGSRGESHSQATEVSSDSAHPHWVISPQQRFLRLALIISREKKSSWFENGVKSRMRWRGRFRLTYEDRLVVNQRWLRRWMFPVWVLSTEWDLVNCHSRYQTQTRQVSFHPCVGIVAIGRPQKRKINEAGRCIWGAEEMPRVPACPGALAGSAPAGRKIASELGCP